MPIITTCRESEATQIFFNTMMISSPRLLLLFLLLICDFFNKVYEIVVEKLPSIATRTENNKNTEENLTF